MEITPIFSEIVKQTISIAEYIAVLFVILTTWGLIRFLKSSVRPGIVEDLSVKKTGKDKKSELEIQNEIAKKEKKLSKKLKRNPTKVLIDTLYDEAKTIATEDIRNAVCALARKLTRLQQAGAEVSKSYIRYFKEYIAVLHKYNEGIDNIDPATQQNRFAEIHDSIYNITYRMLDGAEEEMVNYLKQDSGIQYDLSVLNRLITPQETVFETEDGAQLKL